MQVRGSGQVTQETSDSRAPCRAGACVFKEATFGFHDCSDSGQAQDQFDVRQRNADSEKDPFAAAAQPVNARRRAVFDEFRDVDHLPSSGEPDEPDVAAGRVRRNVRVRIVVGYFEYQRRSVDIVGYFCSFEFESSQRVSCG